PARRLLWEFAANIPGGARTFESMTPDAVQHAARTELETHEDADRSHREAAARRLIKLDDLQQMFGTTLGLAPATMGEG
ncbi:hypothetical protein ABZ351_36965, partial [Streptomyces microflavus]